MQNQISDINERIIELQKKISTDQSKELIKLERKVTKNFSMAIDRISEVSLI